MIPGRAIPNVITVARIALCPVIFALIFVPTFAARFTAWILFLIAAFSDLWDGYLARKHGWISDFGKLVDPIADKLLLVATFIPFYILSNRDPTDHSFPVIDTLPLWIVLVIFGRELFITLFRSYAARRGVVIPAGPSGKYKAVFQNVFVGSAILWYALLAEANLRGWDGPVWRGWVGFHFAFSVVVLTIAVILTIYSMFVYLWNYRSLVLANDRVGG